MKKIFITTLLIALASTVSIAQVISPEGEQPLQNPNKKSVVIKQEGYETPPEELPLNELSFKQRLRIGGGLTGLSIGNPTSIGLSPMVGYQATDNLILGVGGTYQYTKYNNSPFFGSLKFSQVGYRAFAMRTLPFLQELIGGGFAQVEYEQLQNISQGQTTSFRPALLAGIGMSTGGRRAINITALYDFNYKSYDPQGSYSVSSSPIVLRIGGFFF
jgi:hypothetical protein